MKKYLGVKIVSAEPMTQGNAWAEGHNGVSCCAPGEDREGYKVVYEDGYASWSPKEVFEKAYKEIEEPESSEDAFVSLEVDVRSGDWNELLPENLKVSQPESLSRIDMLKLEALQKAIDRNPNDIIALARTFYEFLAE